MNLNQLEYFVAVAQQRSFTKAADQFYLSQTALTQQVRALEETLGTQLIDRRTRPISLTPAGEVFLQESKGVLEKMRRAINRAQDASVGLVGTLRIGYTKGYERSDLSNTLRAFHLKYPNVLLTCYRTNTDALAAGILDNTFDILFTWDSTNLRQDARLKYRCIEQAQLVVAMYASHPLAQRAYLLREELKNEKIIFMTHSSTGFSFGDSRFIQLYQNAGFEPEIIFRSNDAESVLMMVAAEEGISILPGYCTNKLDRAENLVFVPLLGDGEWEEILAVWRAEDSSPPLIQFLEMLG